MTSRLPSVAHRAEGSHEADKSLHRPRAPFAPLRTAKQDYRRSPGARQGLFPATRGPSQARISAPARESGRRFREIPSFGLDRGRLRPFDPPCPRRGAGRISGGAPGPAGPGRARRLPCPIRRASALSERGPCPLEGRANAPAIWCASYGGGRMLGSGSPESSTVSPTSRTGAPSSSGKTNPRERPPFEGTADDLAGARAGTVVGNPR